MAAREAFVMSGGVLGAVQTFHALREKREQSGFLSLPEAQVLVHLRDLFEPLRMGAHGAFRAPVEVPIRREGMLIASRGRQRVEVVRVSLREVFVALHDAVPLGSRVALSIAGQGGRRGFRFRGRVVAVDPETSDATVLLLSAVGGAHPEQRPGPARTGRGGGSRSAAER